MAANVAEAPAPTGNPTDNPGPETARTPRRWLNKKKLLIGGVVVLILVVQAFVTYLVLPAPPDLTVEDSATDKHESMETATNADSIPDESELAEVALGDYSFSNGIASPGIVVHVDFKLAALASDRQSKSFDHAVKAHPARVRQVVGKVVRSSSLEDLNDPNLSTVKRLIREDLNRLLKKSFIVEIVITDIRIMEH